MVDKIRPSLLTLPVELVYRILDNLHEKAILLSVRNVCTRLNLITDTYHRYQVNISFYFQINFSSCLKQYSFQQKITIHVNFSLGILI